MKNVEAIPKDDQVTASRTRWEAAISPPGGSGGKKVALRTKQEYIWM
jgi:hypothetical protein